ncbi:MAG TPA: acyltransferase family protein, partial [Lysobacter sp.]
MSSPESGRLHYLDALRSMLMLFGLVLHASRPYDTYDWRVNDPAQWPVLDHVVWFLHLFRMPAFFVIAGFFAMYLVRRRPTGVFVAERARRTLIPLFVTLFTLNVAQAWFVSRVANGQGGDFLQDVLLPGLWSGSVVSHLWFLACLAVYFALTALAAPWLRGLGSSGSAPSARTLTFALVAIVAGAACFRVGVSVLDKLTQPGLHQMLLGLVAPFTLLRYLPFFVVGLLLCAYPALLQRFARFTPWVVVVAAAGAGGLYLSSGETGLMWKVVQLLSRAVLIWMVIRTLFALFQRFANRPSATMRYLSEASYSVYLFHHIVVVVAATLLIPYALPVPFKFALVLLAAASISLAVYHGVIRRSPVFSYLFNGAIRP